MRIQRDVEIDLRANGLGGIVTSNLELIGGFPVVVLPLDSNKNVIAQGCGCCSARELIDALRWAYNTMTPFVRIIPAAYLSDDA